MVALKGRMIEKWTMIPQATNKAAEIVDGAFTTKELAELIAFSRKVDTSKINLGMVPVVERENFALYIDNSRQFRRSGMARNYSLGCDIVRGGEI